MCPYRDWPPTEVVFDIAQAGNPFNGRFPGLIIRIHPAAILRRARDVLDILLIDTLGELDYPATAGAARRVFEERATHAFPPTFVMPPEWRPELENLALELGLTLATAAENEQRFLEIIRLLERAAPTHKQ